MENESKQQPKPSDDVQLEIETVTPDTEKNAIENDNEVKKDSKETVAPEVTGESETEENSATEEENNKSDEHKAQPGAPDIETVSP
ncbi:hypothetical protein LPB86_17845 [Pedobacter sp. MC2016-14]|uniref:hypothetical protein n=1 Tax=Pedobacter sp. MC2016-14 TaxID=2897327 RepID=UPI001E57902F|nr:hypothetical protein [Pedobacter sp. MC2016-14]MCD0490108.1 hypothetical protein [Pedobacter sp. MC2016-14]